MRQLRLIGTLLATVAMLVACAVPGASTPASSQAPSATVAAAASATAQASLPDVDPVPGYAEAIKTLQPNGAGQTRAGATIQVMGTCNSRGGLGMLLSTKGFPKNG